MGMKTVTDNIYNSFHYIEPNNTTTKTLFGLIYALLQMINFNKTFS